MRLLMLFTLSLSFLMTSLHAQMTIDGNTLYGNEWINHNQDYYKCYVTEDGMYRISTQTLTDAGVPVGAIQAGEFQLYAFGNRVPIHVSANGALGAGDYVEFYGKKNRGELDAHLYAQSDDLFNPYYSMFTDSTAYFLTWENAAVQFQDMPNDLTALPPAEPYFMDEQLLVYNDRYHKGEPNAIPGGLYGLFESRYTEGEGFGTRLNQITTGTLSTPYAYTAGGADAALNVKFAASSAADHYTQLSLNGTALPFSIIFSGYDVIDLNENFSVNLLSSGTADFQLSGLLGSADEYSTAFVKITYPRQFNFGNQDEYHFKIDADPAKKYLEITNFNHGGVAPILYDLTNNLRITTNLAGNTIRIALPPSATERELLLVSQNNYQNISDLDAVNFVDYTTTQGDYMIISNPLLFDDGAGNNYVQEYADYRASTGFTPIIITTEQLYDQFAYGISRHAQSVRNLTGYTLDNWATAPRYMFMIGKSRPHYAVRKNWNAQPTYTLTFGNEPSDMLLTATNTSDVPRIAFGKLPVTNPDQIRIYLDKVMAHENLNLTQTIEDRAWQKRIVHLGGGGWGTNSTAQDLIDGLKEYEAIAKDEFFGADVTTFSKADTEPIDYSPTQLLDSLMNEGVSMITFFGHSSPNNIDFNIRLPGEYNNTNRYPLFFSLGAYNGQIHTKTFGMSEQFIFEENKGAIAYMGMASLAGFEVYGLIEQSSFFNEVFYQKLSKDNYGEGIGDIHRAALSAVADDADILKRMVYQQMTFNGDPAVRLHAAPAPDYLVNTSTSNITFAPDTPTTDDELDLTFNIVNLGKAENQPVKVLVERILPNGDVVIVVNEMVDAPSFQEEYTFDIPAIADAVGTNEFIITLDSDNLIVELPNPDAEGNNTATASIFIYDGIIKPVSPTNYGIEPDANNISLQAEINYRYANQSLNYIIQIDTTELFDSSLKMETTITQTGGILDWSPSMNFVDETVYYWRVKAVTGQVPDAADWQNHSFVYLNGEFPGWNQSHHYQFLDNTYDNTLLYNENIREFEYPVGGIEVEVDNAHLGVLEGYQIDYSIQGNRIYDVEFCEYDKAGIYVVLIDENAQPIQNEAVDLNNNIGQYGSYICKNTQPAFTFPTEDAAGQQVLADFLNNTLPTLSNVSNVLIYSLNDYLPETWSSNLFAAFSTLGATDLQTVTEGVPYAALIDLENNTAQQMTANSESDILEAIFFIRDVWTRGSMTSTVIGPALEWGSLHWDVTSETGDNALINVYGIDDNGQRTLLVEDITANDHLFDVDVVDADAYPYLQLEYVTTDASNQTPPQLDFWRVLYTPNPCYQLKLTVLLEGAFDANTGEMRTALSTDRKILPGQTPVSPLVSPTPAGQPYALAPWNYNGVEGTNFTNSNYQGNEVDWVLVGLRTGIQKADEVSQAAGLLMKDGTIRFPAECPVRTDEPGPFYIVVEHRNHMGTMSEQPVLLTDRDILMDFTTQNSYTNNNVGSGQVEITPGVWAMIAGDLDQTIDNSSYDVNAADKIEWESGNGNFDTYRTTDANLNGDTNGEDKILWELNNGKFSQVPR